MTMTKNLNERRKECRKAKARQNWSEGKMWARRECKVKTKSLEMEETSKFSIGRIVINQPFLKCQIGQGQVLKKNQQTLITTAEFNKFEERDWVIHQAWFLYTINQLPETRKSLNRVEVRTQERVDLTMNIQMRFQESLEEHLLQSGFKSQTRKQVQFLSSSN